MQRPDENLLWQPTPVPNPQPYDGAISEVEHKNYFTPHRFYCIETICAPCGVVIAWAKFAKSESPTNILSFWKKFIQQRSHVQIIFVLTKLVMYLVTALVKVAGDHGGKQHDSLLIHTIIQTIM